MCGIVAVIGSREAAPLLLEGLRQLEYSGYNSAGIATVNGERQLNNLVGLHTKGVVFRVLVSGSANSRNESGLGL